MRTRQPHDLRNSRDLRADEMPADDDNRAEGRPGRGGRRSRRRNMNGRDMGERDMGGRGGRGGHRGRHGGPPWEGRRRMRRGDIRTALLAALGEGPGHGYDVMQTLEEKTGGAWRPSPGSGYPTLQLLEDEGLVQ